jgi:hypothetical protein
MRCLELDYENIFKYFNSLLFHSIQKHNPLSHVFHKMDKE